MIKSLFQLNRHYMVYLAVHTCKIGALRLQRAKNKIAMQR